MATIGHNQPSRPFRGWDEAFRLGRELAAHPERRGIVAKLRELDDRHFATAPPGSDREAVHILITGIIASTERR
jgi:hypothetical protein